MRYPELPAKTNRRELRKAILRMRLELHRQELRREGLLLLQPLNQARQFSSSLRQDLKGSASGPGSWLVAGGSALLFGLLARKQNSLLRWLRIGTLSLQLLRKRPRPN